MLFETGVTELSQLGRFSRLPLHGGEGGTSNTEIMAPALDSRITFWRALCSPSEKFLQRLYHLGEPGLGLPQVPQQDSGMMNAGFSTDSPHLVVHLLGLRELGLQLCDAGH